ncbi:formylglycine-generating enzyme family protein [Hymenobacter armeniacus]|uniref:SUMF1/EgtB/PvdO family nonheme iron enzyme n=1 Tax=Hymenobacter armeniacus TaxID=2771358 RepID=A0ABR8JUT2_9BACT|nr:SUMF1/EgtB/PvdO family nonheme iron enzyme [Hymenobacter armeniacus]MBD2722282.1 SUMF1/EgtB/PvdO family nonheme iron enzyme [Hymenobacter armeniacus]
MKQLLLSASILVGVLQLSGCGARLPSSLRPGYYSASTALPLWPANYVTETPPKQQGNTVVVSIEGQPTPNPAPFYDYKVVKFASGLKLCRDTFRVPDLSKAVRGPIAPGVIVFSASGLAIDEAEITNLDWRLFVADVFPADSSSADILATILPDAAALPVKDYYTSPFYAYYPVVGISYEQAKLFCKWRSEAVNKRIAESKDYDGFAFEYRLPTEAEWEEAAEVRSGQPYGTTCTQLPVQVAEGAAAYLQKRAAVSTPVAQIKADIAAYNKQHPVRSWINHAQPEPYFLRLASPGYVYQGPANDFGLYQMLGNAAEMVEEQGIAKGGSYRDDLAGCTIKARGHYSGPSATVGFRTVCIMQHHK